MNKQLSPRMHHTPDSRASQTPATPPSAPKMKWRKPGAVAAAHAAAARAAVASVASVAVVKISFFGSHRPACEAGTFAAAFHQVLGRNFEKLCKS